MGLIKSEKLTVFPSARRSAKYPDARLMSEQAFTSIVNRCIEYDSFIIEYHENTQGNLTGKFAFNIHGYYFSTDFDSIKQYFPSVAQAGDKIYASIEIIKSGNYEEIWGQDVEPTPGAATEYQGLQITLNSMPAAQHGGEMYHLLLLQFLDDKWQVYPDSLFRFTSKTVKFELDGGEF